MEGWSYSFRSFHEIFVCLGLIRPPDPPDQDGRDGSRGGRLQNCSTAECSKITQKWRKNPKSLVIFPANFDVISSRDLEAETGEDDFQLMS